ncbi:hypothetical protein BH23ACT6_BH23ACT6_14800 [soil metagenome]
MMHNVAQVFGAVASRAPDLTRRAYVKLSAR